MDDTIIDFLQKQNVVTIGCADADGNPYCFPCFFAFNSKQQLLYFKTSPAAYHTLLISKRPEVAGTVLPDRLNVLALKGIQLEGVVLTAEHELASNASKYYYRKFPMALLIPGEIYTIELKGIKMTDGAKGFGKKIIWKKPELVS